LSSNSSLVQPPKATEPSLIPTSTVRISSDTGSHSNKCLLNIAALNKSFSSWVEKMPMKQSWESGVSDYIAYAEKILDESPGAEDGTSQTSPSFKSSEKLNKSSSAIWNSQENVSQSNNKVSFSTFGSSTELKSKSASNTFSFGSSSETKPSTDSKPFSFNSGSTSSGIFGNSGSGSSGLFSGSSSFGSTPALSQPSQANRDEPENEAEEEKVEKVESKIADDEELLHEVRAKVMWYRKNDDEGTWGAKGTGQLLLLKQKEGNLRWLLMRTETTGRVTYNCPLYASLKVTPDIKGKAVSFVAVSYAEDKSGRLVAENEGKPSLFRIRVKTSEAAEALAKAIQDALPL